MLYPLSYGRARADGRSVVYRESTARPSSRAPKDGRTPLAIVQWNREGSDVHGRTDGFRALVDVVSRNDSGGRIGEFLADPPQEVHEQ